MNNVIVICLIDSSIIYSLSSGIYIYPIGYPYSDMGTEYIRGVRIRNPRYLWNYKIK